MIVFMDPKFGSRSKSDMRGLGLRNGQIIVTKAGVEATVMKRSSFGDCPLGSMFACKGRDLVQLPLNIWPSA